MKKCTLKDNCRYCGSTMGYIYPSTNRYHAGFIKCCGCDRHLKWISKSNFELAIALNLVND